MITRSSYIPAIILLLFASFYITKQLKRQSAPQIDLPGIALKDLNGSPVNLADFAGKPLIVHFWGSWCSPCRQELPGFEKARNKYDGQINFLMVSDESLDKIIKFKSENNYTFFYTHSQKAFKELGFTSVPVTYFYDSKGQLVANKKDPLNEEELNEFIEKAIK